MSPQVQAALDQLTSAIDATTARVQQDVKALNDQIAALQAQVDAGSNDPVLIQALSDAKSKLDAIDPTSSTTLATAHASTQTATKAPAHPKP